MKWSSLGVPLLIVSLGLLPVAAYAQKVSFDYDKGVDFSKFKTYAWQPGQPAPNPLVDKRIINAIEGQLASKGWTKVEDSPSAIVIYQAAVNEQRQLNAWGSGPRWNGFGCLQRSEQAARLAGLRQRHGQ